MNIIFPISAVFIWATNAVISKLATGTIEPGAIAFYRWFFAFIILLPFCLKPLLQQKEIVLKSLGKLAVLASLGMVLNQCLAYYAAHTTSATNIAVFLSLMPLFGLFLAVPLLGNKFKKQALLGATISFSGLVFMLSEGNPSNLLISGIKQGDALMFISSLAYALYSVLLNKWKIPLPTWTSVFCQVAIGAILQLPLLLVSNSYVITGEAFPMILFAAVFASVLAPWFWLQGVRRIGASNATLFMNLVPVFTVLINLVFIGDSPTAYHLIGGGFVLVGLITAQIKVNLLRSPSSPKAV
ncbi:DMT family transporter [Vibrio cyclitrophicus]|uniref:DMT family transporter n=1 Tax=Vibrio cyclitrophicus TaxID=47951 RepID=UPI00148BABDD|nr:DMT family transporter [Vibrio cyclitrophicus]NOI36226.1 DMT family transporter [Vibrio cyclitrophicus]